MESAGLIAALALCAFSATQDASTPPEKAAPQRPGFAALAEATRVFDLGNPEQARVEVERAIDEMLAARPDAQDAEDDRALRDAGALAYKLRSMEPARRAWDAVRRYREKTSAPTSLELQNARGTTSWIGEQMGLVDEARRLEEQILAALEASLPPEHDALQMARANLGDTLLQQGELERGAELFASVAQVRRAKLPAGHPQRLRAELDQACGLVARGNASAAVEVLTGIQAACAPEHASIRLRLAAIEALYRRTSHVASQTNVGLLAREIETSRAQIATLPWREAEARTAELGPFVDLLLSTLDARPGHESTEWILAPLALLPSHALPYAVYRRYERTRVEGADVGRRVLADERLGAAVFRANVSPQWIDLGPLASARALVQAWDDAARNGAATDQRDAVANALFAPVAQALGSSQRMTIVPDDVIWAVPLHALALRSSGADAHEIAVEAALPRPQASIAPVDGDWCVLGDPAPATKTPAEAQPPVPTRPFGGAAAYLAGPVPSTKDATEAWARRVGGETFRGADATLGRFVERMGECRGIVLTVPWWSAPDEVPCVTARRPIVASTPLAAALAREDVFGGSSPEDLCGLRFAGHAQQPDDDRRVASSPRAADLREIRSWRGHRLVFTQPPPSGDVVRRARDVESLARALVAAGCMEACFALRPIADVERVTLPSEIEQAFPRRAVAADRVAGPWLRVRADF